MNSYPYVSSRDEAIEIFKLTKGVIVMKRNNRHQRHNRSKRQKVLKDVLAVTADRFSKDKKDNEKRLK